MTGRFEDGDSGRVGVVEQGGYLGGSGSFSPGSRCFGCWQRREPSDTSAGGIWFDSEPGEGLASRDA
jgi:hypothetical protein